MPRAIRFREAGGLEMLRWKQVEVGEPGPGQARIRQPAGGLNLIDVYMHSGFYPVPDLPANLGMEATGVVKAVGTGATEVATGDRIAYAMVHGGYAEQRLIQTDKPMKRRNAIDDQGVIHWQRPRNPIVIRKQEKPTARRYYWHDRLKRGTLCDSATPGSP